MSHDFELLKRIEQERGLAYGPGAPRISPELLPEAPERGVRMGQPAAKQAGASLLEWRRAVQVVVRNWKPAVLVGGTIFLVVVLVTLLQKSIYSPTARIEIEPPGEETFSLQGEIVGSGDPEYVQTQVASISSDDLALEVIRALHLDENPEFADPDDIKTSQAQKNGGRATTASVSVNGKPQPLTDAENDALDLYQTRLLITRDSNGRMISISFGSHDPVLAAQVTNSLVDHFIEKSHRMRSEAISRSAEWLSKQLDDIRGKMDKSNQELADFQHANGMIDVDWKQDPVAQAVQGLNHELTNAQVERIQYESFLKAVESGNADSLPQMRDNLMIQSLIEKSAELKGELAQALVTYGKNNPNAKRLQQQVDVLDAELTKQRRSVYTSIRISYQAAKQREAMLDQQLKSATSDVGLTARFLELKKKAQANSDLYNTLYTQVQQANITAASRSSNISVVDRARVLDMPSHPKKMLNLAVGLMAAMFGGLLIAFVKEGLDPTIRSSQEFKHWNGIPAVALMPVLISNGNGKRKSFREYLGHRKRASLEGDHGLEKFLLDRPLSPEAEAIRNLHASIVLANHGSRRMFLIASAMPGEGKTTLATNLALSLARHSKTCLVDGDMRRPSVAQAFGLECQHGLADVLLATVPLADALLTVPSVPNLTVLPATPLSPEVVQLVDTLPKRGMLQELRTQFEYVVIDSSPLVPFADSRSIAPLVDGIVLVGRYGVTSRSSVARCVELLSEIHAAPIVQFVMNGVEVKSAEYTYDM